jgi:hypothetical protein
MQKGKKLVNVVKEAFARKYDVSKIHHNRYCGLHIFHWIPYIASRKVQNFSISMSPCKLIVVTGYYTRYEVLGTNNNQQTCRRKGHRPSMR